MLKGRGDRAAEAGLDFRGGVQGYSRLCRPHASAAWGLSTRQPPAPAPPGAGQHPGIAVATEAPPLRAEEGRRALSGGRGGEDTWAQLPLNVSRTVELVCSNSHCWVGEEGLQMFMKILWSLSLQSMQLPLTGW